MKSLVTVLAVVAVLGMTTIALCGATSRPAGVFGALVKVDGKNLVVKTQPRGGEAKEVTVGTDDKTTYLVDAEVGKLADLKAEMNVRITLVEGSTDKAAKVTATSKGVNGTFVKLDGKNVVLSTGRRADAKEVTVVTDDKTKVFLTGTGGADPKAITLADLKAGMRVTAIPETGTATKLIASPVRVRPGATN